MCIEQPGQMERSRRQDQLGVTLIELIMFIVIVSTALMGVLSVLNMTIKNSADPLVHKQMLAVAEGLLDEVEMMQYTVCDPSGTNTNLLATTTAGCSPGSVQQFGYPALGASPRSNFNNVGNYCSNAGPGATTCSLLTLGSASAPIPDVSGSTSSTPPGYWATIALTPENLWGITSNSTALTMNVLRITVTVYHSGTSDTIVLEGYRTRWTPTPLISS